MTAGEKSWETKKRKLAARRREYRRRFEEAKKNEKWAVTMSKVRIRQAVARAPWPRWHLLTFNGPEGGESRGVVDMIAIRKDHGGQYAGTKRGDSFQIILIQIKGGQAAKPTKGDCKRLRRVAKRDGACGILLAKWRKGTSARFFSLSPNSDRAKEDWTEVGDLVEFFG